MAPKKSNVVDKGKSAAVATTSIRQTRSMDRQTRSETRRRSGASSSGSSSSKLMKFESPEKKKRKTKAKEGGATKKIKKEEEEVEVKKEEESAEEDDDVDAEEEVAEEKKIVIEHCKQCNSFKTRANQVKAGLEEAVPGIVVTVNAVKPRRGCFEIREEGGQTFISLLDMKRPFKPMKDLDMEQVIADIIEKIK